METNKDFSKLEAPERIKTVKEKFGEFVDFLEKANPKSQISFSDKEKALSGNYPTLKDICLTYGKNAAENWLLPQVIDLGAYADAVNMTEGQFSELASVIAKECQVDVKKLWLSSKEAKKYLGVSKDWLKDRRNEGKLHYAVVGNTIFYIKSEIDRLVVSGAISGRTLFLKETH